jgi:dolichol-phosphate mannosyltransferase
MPTADLRAPVEATPAGPLRVRPLDEGCAVDVSLVVPTFNESETIADFLAAVRIELDAARPGRYEVIVVDDDSPDRTWRIAAEQQAGFPELRVVRRLGERGLASAVIRGWQAARAPILGTINADFQHPPAVLGHLSGAIDGADIVVASATRTAAGSNRGPASDTWALVPHTSPAACCCRTSSNESPIRSAAAISAAETSSPTSSCARSATRP